MSTDKQELCQPGVSHTLLGLVGKASKQAVAKSLRKGIDPGKWLRRRISWEVIRGAEFTSQNKYLAQSVVQLEQNMSRLVQEIKDRMVRRGRERQKLTTKRGRPLRWEEMGNSLAELLEIEYRNGDRVHILVQRFLHKVLEALKERLQELSRSGAEWGMEDVFKGRVLTLIWWEGIDKGRVGAENRRKLTQ